MIIFAPSLYSDVRPLEFFSSIRFTLLRGMSASLGLIVGSRYFNTMILNSFKVPFGPYIEMKEAIGGYVIVRATSIDEAAELTKDCPNLKLNCNVEVR